VARAINIALNELLDKAEEIDKQQECLVHCAGGYRSMIAASILKQKGFQNIKNVWGGYNKIKEEIIDLVVPNN
jgi:hydroxyacylglutathione hydrolase